MGKTGAFVPAVRSERGAEREWCASDRSCRITASNGTLEQMRSETSRAMNGPGGQGIGGILLGTRLGSFFRVVRFIPIVCDYSMGPDFQLSAYEESVVAKVLADLKSEAEPDGLMVVGWFVSHPRGDLQMSEGERSQHEKFFGGAHLALVAKPNRLGEMDLAVHYAKEGHNACGDLMEPVLTVVPDPFFRPARKSALDRRLEAEAQNSTPSPLDSAKPWSVPGAPDAVKAHTHSTLMVAGLLVVLLISAFGVFYLNRARWEIADPPRSIAKAPIQLVSLHVYEDSGRFYVSWNGKAEALRRASRVVLTIQDGQLKAQFELSNEERLTGVRLYRRVTNNVTATLEVHGNNGAVEAESAHYVGRSLTPPLVFQPVAIAPATEK